MSPDTAALLADMADALNPPEAAPTLTDFQKRDDLVVMRSSVITVQMRHLAAGLPTEDIRRRLEDAVARHPVMYRTAAEVPA